VAAKELLYDLGVARPTALLVEGRYITEFPGWTLYIGRRRGENEFADVLLTETRKEQLVRRIRARRASVAVDAATRQVVFRLFDAEVFTRAGGLAPGLPAGEGTPGPPAAAELDWGMAIFDEAPPVRLDLSGSHPLEAKPKYSEMNFTQLRAERRDLQLQGIDPTPVLVNLHRQVSFSFACFSFTLVGIPLGIRGHRRETSFGIAAALLLTAVYYSFIVLGQALETSSHLLPHLLVWVPNFLFQGIGAWLLCRANRGL
jgi:lipopolysaccharide export system permease protein